MKQKLTQLLFVIACVLNFFCTLPRTIYCEENNSDIKILSREDSCKTYLEGGKWLGIHTEIVTTDNYNLGLGIGGRLCRKFFYPVLKSSSIIHFWGASSDSTDISVIAIEENLTYRIPIHEKINGYMGFSFGYCFSNEKIEKLFYFVQKSVCNIHKFFALTLLYNACFNFISSFCGQNSFHA